MTLDSLADLVRSDSRIGRALRLLEEHATEVEKVAPYTYLVPSCSGKHRYRVVYGGKNEKCSCPGFEFHGEEGLCKHQLAVGILSAKKRVRGVAA